MASASDAVKRVFYRWRNIAQNSNKPGVYPNNGAAIETKPPQPDMSSDSGDSSSGITNTSPRSMISFGRPDSACSRDSIGSSYRCARSSINEDYDDDDNDYDDNDYDDGGGDDVRDIWSSSEDVNRQSPTLGTFGTSDPPSCDGCGSDVQALSWCNLCQIILCDNCWKTQAAHKETPRTRGRKKHGKTDFRLWQVIESILNPDTDAEKQEALHRENFGTKWFGVELDENTRKPYFHDYGQYFKLVSKTRRGQGTQYPSITCFVGETGHGKSTLINALMKINGHFRETVPLRAPVMGANTELDDPTSDSVHLFADPITYSSDRPYFYADCEGLSGGNKIPMATRAYRGVKNFQKRRQAKNQVRTDGGDAIDLTGTQGSRQWVVENFYPRVLFTFSDVVCFVTKNFRALERVISKLIEWADKAFQKSVNQPVLPYAVIVVNALEVDNPNSTWWDIEHTTNEQLEKRADCINEDPYIQRIVRKWKSLGKDINNLEELLMCYYSGIKIVCIPHARESPAIIDRQYKDLYKVIEEGSKKAYDLRIKAGLLMTSEELGVYLRHAFHHFSKNPSRPFNFLTAAFHHNPIPSTFKDHIAKAAIHFMDQLPDLPGANIFSLLARVVASCILLDAYRNRYPHGGAAATIFPGYKQFCIEALEEVYEKHWRCEVRDKKGVRCANVSTGHSKGHQLDSGKVFAAGEFFSVYMKNKKGEENDFVYAISSELDKLLNKFSTGQELSAVALYHRNNVQKDYSSYWGWKGGDPEDNDQSENRWPLTVHTTCFSCLSATPVYALHCGHILCDRCVEDYSEPPSSSTTLWREIKFCPLCSNTPLAVPWKYKVRPQYTGLRILSLDGGGIRGILQLVMLDALEKKIDLGIPIQDFFDLIIGTGTGGIIALALTTKRLSVRDCTEMFNDFSEQAFTKRTGVDTPGIKAFVEARYHSKYETRGIDRFLGRRLGDDILFGGKKYLESLDVSKVGVTATLSSGPCLLANYNRPLAESLKNSYDFLRAENSHQELEVWEAARATSAAPGYFKPFFHKPSGYTFSDGGLRYNNPVNVADCERKLLWPHLSQKHPDLLLSIGTGYDPTESDVGRQGRREKAKHGAVEFAKTIFKLATQPLESSLNCERTWSEFLRSIPTKDEDKAAKYRRLTVKFSDNNLPEFDQVDQMGQLKKTTERFCIRNPLIDEIATRLIASLFYFKLDRAFQVGRRWECEGTILCRLEPDSEALKKLCERLRLRQSSQHRSSVFYMNEKSRRSTQPDKYFPTEPTVFRNAMDYGGPFEMKINFAMYGPEDSMRLYLTLSKEEPDTSLISGFPCRILKEHESSPLARNGSNSQRISQRSSSQRPMYRRSPSASSARSVPSSASSIYGIFRGSIGHQRMVPYDLASTSH